MARGYKPRQTEPPSTEELVDEIGFDDRDIPGGIPHQINHPVAPHYPLDPGPARDQFRGPMASGVAHAPATGKPKQDYFEESHNMATVDPRQSSEQQRMVPPDKPVPVSIVEKAAGQNPLAKISSYQVQVPSTGPVALFGRDLKRSHASIRNEDTVNGVRIGYSYSAAEFGFYIPPGQQSPRFSSQDAVYAVAAPNATYGTVGVAASGTVTTSGGTVTLPAGDSLAGFQLTFLAPSTSGGTVSVTGIGTPLTYILGTASTGLNVSYPAPIPSYGGTGVPSVGVVSISGIGNGSLVLEGVSAGSASTSTAAAVKVSVLLEYGVAAGGS